MERSSEGRRAAEQTVEPPHHDRLSCAISAHRQFCHDFATAVKDNEGKRLVHPATSSHYPGYDISAYYTQAMASREQIFEFYSNDMPTNTVVVALPRSFERVLTELEPEATSSSWQFNKLSITAAMVLVWPEVTPTSVNMRQFLQVIESHLQCGGALDCFLAPFERALQAHWVCVCVCVSKLPKC